MDEIILRVGSVIDKHAVADTEILHALSGLLDISDARVSESHRKALTRLSVRLTDKAGIFGSRADGGVFGADENFAVVRMTRPDVDEFSPAREP